MPPQKKSKKKRGKKQSNSGNQRREPTPQVSHQERCQNELDALRIKRQRCSTNIEGASSDRARGMFQRALVKVEAEIESAVKLLAASQVDPQQAELAQKSLMDEYEQEMAEQSEQRRLREENAERQRVESARQREAHLEENRVNPTVTFTKPQIETPWNEAIPDPVMQIAEGGALTYRFPRNVQYGSGSIDTVRTHTVSWAQTDAYYAGSVERQITVLPREQEIEGSENLQVDVGTGISAAIAAEYRVGEAGTQVAAVRNRGRLAMELEADHYATATRNVGIRRWVAPHDLLVAAGYGDAGNLYMGNSPDVDGQAGHFSIFKDQLPVRVDDGRAAAGLATALFPANGTSGFHFSEQNTADTHGYRGGDWRVGGQTAEADEDYGELMVAAVDTEITRIEGVLAGAWEQFDADVILGT